MQRDGVRRGYQEWRCRVKKATRNTRRIFVGKAYVGMEHQYPAPREAVKAFVQNLKEAHGTHE